jgi:hypothetical protein
MKMCEDFTPNFGDERNGCCITTMHHLTLPFSPNPTRLLPLPTHPTFLLPQFKIRLKECHFDMTVVTKV